MHVDRGKNLGHLAQNPQPNMPDRSPPQSAASPPGQAIDPNDPLTAEQSSGEAGRIKSTGGTTPCAYAARSRVEESPSDSDQRWRPHPDGDRRFPSPPVRGKQKRKIATPCVSGLRPTNAGSEETYSAGHGSHAGANAPPVPARNANLPDHQPDGPPRSPQIPPIPPMHPHRNGGHGASNSRNRHASAAEWQRFGIEETAPGTPRVIGLHPSGLSSFPQRESILNPRPRMVFPMEENGAGSSFTISFSLACRVAARSIPIRVSTLFSCPNRGNHRANLFGNCDRSRPARLGLLAH